MYLAGRSMPPLNRRLQNPRLRYNDAQSVPPRCARIHNNRTEIMIEVNETIDVASDPKTVWALLSDPRAVVECVQGASLGEQDADGTYDAGIMVKFGPAKVAFKARVDIEYDEPTMSGKVSSRGKDKQGGARFNTAMNFKVIGQPAGGTGSQIHVAAQVEISGKLASLIETGASMVVKRMTKEFSEALAARVAGSGAA
jgi:carbon monoxide dehydrogenase subunit G